LVWCRGILLRQRPKTVASFAYSSLGFNFQGVTPKGGAFWTTGMPALRSPGDGGMPVSDWSRPWGRTQGGVVPGS
jgi:hypothetical protein